MLPSSDEFYSDADFIFQQNLVPADRRTTDPTIQINHNLFSQQPGLTFTTEEPQAYCFFFITAESHAEGSPSKQK